MVNLSNFIRRARLDFVSRKKYYAYNIEGSQIDFIGLTFQESPQIIYKAHGAQHFVESRFMLITEKDAMRILFTKG
jgi:hypothetical protein